MLQTHQKSSKLPVILKCEIHQDQTQVVMTYLGQVPPTSLTWFNEAGEGITIAQIRQIINGLQYASLGSGTQRIILLGAQQMTLPAQNALLKILEETPSHSQLILVTCYPNRLLATITSRCQQVNMTQTVTQSLQHSGTDQHYSHLLSSTVSQIIQISMENKDRELATQLLNQLLEEVHQLPATKKTVDHGQLLLRGLSLLEENVNVRIVLEAVLFRIAGLSTAPNRPSNVL